MNIVPTLKVLIALGMTDDEAYEMIGRGKETLMRYLRFRCDSMEHMIKLFEDAELKRI